MAVLTTTGLCEPKPGHVLKKKVLMAWSHLFLDLRTEVHFVLGPGHCSLEVGGKKSLILKTHTSVQ